MRLGIDFGTTRTVVASADGGRYPVVAFRTEGGYATWLDGAVSRDEAGELVFGEEAWRRVASGAGGLRSVKRAAAGLAPEFRMDVAGRDATGLELVAGYLRHLAVALRTRSNLELDAEEPLEAMIAVPANASTRQRFLTLEGFRRAGFEVVGMINEPTAAAIEFAERNRRVLSARSPRKYVVVYDLGGGTFDSSTVSLEDRRFELLGTEGIARFGGEDFDERILEVALDNGLPEPKSGAERLALLEACRRAKEGLHTRSRRLLLDLPDAPGFIVGLDEVYARCEPLVERSLALVERLFERLVEQGLDPHEGKELGAVYLVGGAASFPLVGRLLRARFQRKVRLAPEPHAATAVGLAVAADPDASIFVREATTRHFGVWREASAGRELVFDALLGKDVRAGSDGAVVVERQYRPAHNVGHLRFVECTQLDDNGRPEGDMTPFGELYFPYAPELADGRDLRGIPVRRTPELEAQEIVERYVYEADGRLRVEIENRTGAYRRELTLGSL